MASRRSAEELVRAGRVVLNGETVTDPARDVAAGDTVTVDGVQARPVAERVVYALHKPVGVVSTARDPQRRPTVVSLIDDPRRLYPVGRLDLDSSGLILLTDDGDLAHRLTHPSFEVPKTYQVRIGNPPISRRAVNVLRQGVQLEDGVTAPARVRRLARDRLEITLLEGRNRQVRRMCEAVGHQVGELQRVAFGPLALGELGPGRYRRLSDGEVARLREAGSAARPSPSASRARHGASSPGSARSAAGRPSAGR